MKRMWETLDRIDRSNMMETYSDQDIKAADVFAPSLLAYDVTLH